jgi:signal transduction histidine kinase/FixJ family two-component response regulator
MQPKIAWRILLVDDDEDDYILTRAMSALEILEREHFDVMIVDYDLGGRNGLALVRESNARDLHVPAILLTGRGNYDIDLEAMKAGAADYLEKRSVTGLLLERTIRYAIERQHNQEAMRRANEELELRVQENTQELRLANQDLQSEIQERKRVQEALQESEHSLRLFLEQLPAVVWSTDTRLRVTYSRGEGLASGGLVEVEVDGLLIDDYLNTDTEPSQAANVIQEAHRRSLKGESVRFSLPWRDRIYNCYVEPYHDAEGTLIGCIGVGLDQTESIRTEAELAEVRRRLLDSVESERLRLAQELHDGCMQDLYSLNYLVESLKNELKDQERHELVEAFKEKLIEVIEGLRSTAVDLRPPTLTPFGLEKSIRSHAERFLQAQPDMEVELDLMPDGQLIPERIRLALFRIYQMALTNVVRHANATYVCVRLKVDPKVVSLEVEDNGGGFTVPRRWIELARKGHLGIVGAKERAEAVGGKLNIISSPGEGTLIQVDVPLNRPA